MSTLKMLRFNDLERVQAKNRIPLFLNALQGRNWPGHTGRKWVDQSSWLTGLIPDCPIFAIMSVATVPGLRPRIRIPRAADLFFCSLCFTLGPGNVILADTLRAAMRS